MGLELAWASVYSVILLGRFHTGADRFYCEAHTDQKVPNGWAAGSMTGLDASRAGADDALRTQATDRRANWARHSSWGQRIRYWIEAWALPARARAWVDD